MLSNRRIFPGAYILLAGALLIVACHPEGGEGTESAPSGVVPTQTGGEQALPEVVADRPTGQTATGVPGANEGRDRTLPLDSANDAQAHAPNRDDHAGTDEDEVEEQRGVAIEANSAFGVTGRSVDGSIAADSLADIGSGRGGGGEEWTRGADRDSERSETRTREPREGSRGRGSRSSGTRGADEPAASSPPGARAQAPVTTPATTATTRQAPVVAPDPAPEAETEESSGELAIQAPRAPEEDAETTVPEGSVLRAIGNTNISLGGASDFGLFRRRLEEGTVPQSAELQAAGFFAEHHTPLPEPDCGERVCVQAMLGVLEDLTNGEPRTILQIGLNSPLVADETHRPPLNLAVVVDTSGSMRDHSQIDFVQSGLQVLIDQLQDTDQIAIITYANRANVALEMGPVGDIRSEFRAIVSGLRARGGTNLYRGLEQGYSEVMHHYDSGRQNRIILLSDGMPTSGITGTPDILEMSRAYNSEGIGLTTIGLGREFNVELMSGLAEAGDGNFYYVENAGAVLEVFTDEVSYFTVPIAFDLTLEVEMGDMYRVERTYGSSRWNQTDNGGRFEQPSVFLAHRTSHADVTSSGGRRGGGSALILELTPDVSSDLGSGISNADIASIRLTYREPGTNREVTTSIHVTYPGDPRVMPETGYFQASDPEIIQKSFLMLNLYTALEDACETFHAGHGTQAVGILQRVLAAAEDFNDSAVGGAGDTDIRLDIELAQQLISVMRANGAVDPVALFIPEDPWPVDRDI
jgi:Ca-activated chloride channel family protein